MSIEDIRSVGASTLIEADLCIIGSGPAGWAIAEEFRGTDLRLVMLESGGLERHDDADALNESEDVGATLFNGRARVLGGTSSLWNGRCVPFDDIDYEKRDWVPHSGWPIAPADVAPHLHRASSHLGIVPYHHEDGMQHSLPGLRAPPKVDPALLHDAYWSNPKIIDFGQVLRAQAQPNLRVLVHATVTQLNVNAAGRQIESVEITDLEGVRRMVRAPAVVLAAGGVENARILLYSNRVSSNGVGNTHDVVGRYFMDHPRDFELVARVDPQQARAFRQLFGPYLIDTARGRCEFSHGFKLSPDHQRQERLLNCAAWPYEVVAPEDPFEAARRLRQGLTRTSGRDVWRVVSQPGRVLWGVRERMITRQRISRRVERIGFLIASEQRPDPDSRIRLGARVDRFGLPTTLVDWRISSHETESQATLGKLIASEFSRLGLPAIRLANWASNGAYEEANFVDGCHPTGSTRMASDPCEGVVDADCQVHDVHGLYVAGSSVFPTASHANPTLMIVALAVRLASHLKAQLRQRQTEMPAAGRTRMPANAAVEAGHHRAATVSRNADANVLPSVDAALLDEPRVPPGTVVAVTGATGFIGGRLVERLVSQGANVTCLVRGGGAASSLEKLGVKVLALDLADSEAVCDALKGVELVFNCAYDWSNSEWNVRALRALVRGCDVNECLRLVHVSSFVVYEIPDHGELTEESAQTTATAGYAHNKRLLETELLTAIQSDGLAASIVQPTIVYGPQSRPWTIDPVNRLRHGTVVLPDKGEGICAAVYVDDVVSGMLLAARRPQAIGKRFLISGPSVVTWGQFYEGLANVAGTRGPQYRPAALIAREAAPARKMMRLLTDPERLLRRLAMAPRVRGILDAGLARLPEKPRRGLQKRLFGSSTCRDGEVHMPSLGDLRFLQGRATISSHRARTELDYMPLYDLSAGMAEIAPHLNDSLRATSADSVECALEKRYA